MEIQPLLDPDPDDPAVILGALPEHHRDHFRREYAAALDAARDPANFAALRHMLRLWRLHAYAASQPGYDEHEAWAQQASRTGDWGPGIPLEDFIATQLRA